MVIQDGVGDLPAVEDAALWATELELTYPVLADVEGRFFPVWDPEEILPMTYILDPRGAVARAEAGGASELEAMEEAIVALLEEAPAP